MNININVMIENMIVVQKYEWKTLIRKFLVPSSRSWPSEPVHSHSSAATPAFSLLSDVCFPAANSTQFITNYKKYIEWNLNDTHIKPQSHVLPNYMILLYKRKRMMITSFTSFCRSCTIFSALRIWLVRISTTTWRLFTSFSRYFTWDEGEFVCKRGWSRWETK